VITSHTLDDHRSWTTIDIQPARALAQGSTFPLFKLGNDETGAMPAYKNIPLGEIPQVERTHAYINTSLPCMNDRQLAIGESTFGGRGSLVSEAGRIDLWRLVKILIERCATAREAIRTAGELGKVRMAGVWECLTIADLKEVWHLRLSVQVRDGSARSQRSASDGHGSQCHLSL
jgi:dipeptidase